MLDIIMPKKSVTELRTSTARRRGATMVEFALVVPILLAILLGTMEFGWMAKNKLQLANAVREGARDAAIGLNVDTIKTRIKNRATGIPGVPDNLVIDLQRDDGDTGNGYNYNIPLGDKDANSDGKIFNDAPPRALIRVRVTLPHQSLTNFPFTNNRNLQVEVIMRRESGN